MGFKIYTKTGDKGQTSLFGGRRVSKGHLRIDAYGTVDELNSCIGLLRDHLSDEVLRALLKEIQDRLFTLGANLAADPSKELQKPDLLEEDIKLLEREMDRMDEGLPELRNFILPGGHPTVSFCHLARCVCRRAERLAVTLAEEEPVDPILIQYLNRLSDYLFILGRRIAFDLGIEEVVWKSRG
ncbi:MAG: cob(I)yrinic acid a,c-diamide adenosyltransferase [Saprospirales bacterium]|jgi:cob(I)alamin adenosyltransferase|nr:cob(I)yrinic acid a,c-diamide adenosyltransferase [Saprospirales bacterium]MBK7336232.1 cob(I)yrinic acid a,c-diamide adenosyltransferase [Saprospirales bacterium]